MKTPIRTLPLLLLVAALGVAGCRREAAPAITDDASPAPTPAAEPARPDPVAVGDIVPLAMKTLDGGHFDIAAHRGRWVVVNYWATWCGPCLEEMPELSALDAMREHVQVIGLAYEEIEPDELREFLGKHPVVYPIAVVDVTDPPAAFEVPRGLPMTYLVDPEGRLAKQFLGPVTARQIEEAIAEAGGPAVGA